MTDERLKQIIKKLPQLSIYELKSLKESFEHSLAEGSLHEKSIKIILYYLDIVLDAKLNT